MCEEFEIAGRLSSVSQANGGPEVNASDYSAWMDGMGDGNAERFHAAVTVFLGEETTAVGDTLGFLPALLAWSLKLGPRKLRGLDLHQVLVQTASRALEYRQH